DLARVQVPGEDQVPPASRNRVEGAREVAEQDPEPGVRLREAARTPREPRARVDSGQLDVADPHALVEEQRAVLERIQLDRPRERVARDGEVVVAEDDVRVRERGEQLAQPPLAARAREKVARDADEVGPPPGDPAHGALHGPLPERGHPEVEVGEVRDAEAVELRREARQANFPDPQPHPAGLEHAVAGGEGRDGDQHEEEDQTRSFSTTGSTETTCRLNFSSASSRPAATPTSCERWRIGILK